MAINPGQNSIENPNFEQAQESGLSAKAKEVLPYLYKISGKLRETNPTLGTNMVKLANKIIRKQMAGEDYEQESIDFRLLIPEIQDQLLTEEQNRQDALPPEQQSAKGATVISNYLDQLSDNLAG